MDWKQNCYQINSECNSSTAKHADTRTQKCYCVCFGNVCRHNKTQSDGSVVWMTFKYRQINMDGGILRLKPRNQAPMR